MGRLKSPIVGLVVVVLLMIMSSSCTVERQRDSAVSHGKNSAPISDKLNSTLEESTELHTNQWTEDGMTQELISAEIEPLPNQANQAALALQRLGFRILHIGSTISVQAPRPLWESTFNVSFEEKQKTVMPEIERDVTYLRAVTDHLVIPEGLDGLIAEVMFVEPPEFYQGQP